MYLISTSFQNPYYGLNVWEFIITFFIRFWHFITGSLKFDELASDEVQVGTLFAISLSSAIIGSLLNLRKMSMLANSLSHTILVGIVIAFYLTTTITGQDLSNMSVFALLIGALIMGFVTSFSTEFLHKVTRLQEDASLGLVFTNFFAMGIVLVTILTRNSHIGIEAVMGNVDALSRGDLKLVFYVFIFNYIIYFVFKKELAITSFDAGLARSLGFKTGFYNYLIMSINYSNYSF